MGKHSYAGSHSNMNEGLALLRQLKSGAKSTAVIEEEFADIVETVSDEEYNRRTNISGFVKQQYTDTAAEDDTVDDYVIYDHPQDTKKRKLDQHPNVHTKRGPLDKHVEVRKQTQELQVSHLEMSLENELNQAIKAKQTVTRSGLSCTTVGMQRLKDLRNKLKTQIGQQTTNTSSSDASSAAEPSVEAPQGGLPPNEALVGNEPQAEMGDANPTDQSVDEDMTVVCTDENSLRQSLLSNVNFSNVFAGNEDEEAQILPLVEMSSLRTVERKTEGDSAIITPEHQVLFYWFDMLEDNKQLYMTGKTISSQTGSYISTCVHVKVNRQLLFRIRQQSSVVNDEIPLNLQQELVHFKEKYGHSHVRIKLVQRSYCLFDEWKGETSQPNQSPEYYVKYTYRAHESLPSLGDFSGCHYSHCFGMRTPLPEILITKRRMFGPSWVLLSGASMDEEQLSYCTVNLVVAGIKSIHTIGTLEHLHKKSQLPSDSRSTVELINTLTNTPIPRLSVLSIAVQSSTSGKSGADTTSQKSIIAISIAGASNLDISKPVSGQADQLNTFNALWLRSTDAEVMQSDVLKCFESFENVSFVSNEKSMLMNLCTYVCSKDPDIIVSHNLLNEVCPLLSRRLALHNIVSWHKLSRLRRPKKPLARTELNQGPQQVATLLFSGRLIVDGVSLCTEVLGSRVDYSLQSIFSDLCPNRSSATDIVALTDVQRGHLVRFILNNAPLMAKPKLADCWAIQNLFPAFQKAFNCDLSKKSLMYWVYASFKWEATAQLLAMDMLRILNLTLELTTICGNLWNRSLLLHRAERNEYLLLHKFYDKKLICPEPRSLYDTVNHTNNNTHEDSVPANETEGSFTGGLVLEPIVGFYDTYILYLDFNSLYPSIIQQLCLCFTNPKALKNDEQPPEGGNIHDYILPSTLNSLVTRRRQTKQMMKNAKNDETLANLDCLQKALKLVANSIYGFLGFKKSRFRADPIAARITEYGRQVLSSVKEKSEKLGYTVIYGDTDSIMVDTRINTSTKLPGLLEAESIAMNIMNHVNKKSYLELDLEAIFKGMLLLRKKKYAAMKVAVPASLKSLNAATLELKGIEIVRRDWCELTKIVGRRLLNEIFKEEETESSIVVRIDETLMKTKSELESSSIPVDQFVISKVLTRHPKDYVNVDQHLHVKAAQRLELIDGVALYPGMMIHYVICTITHTDYDVQNRKSGTTADNTTESNGSTSVGARSFPISHFKSSKGLLTIDIQWYLRNQIIPPLERLIGPIDQYEPGRLSAMLGIESSSTTAGIQASSVLQLTHYDDIDGILCSNVGASVHDGALQQLVDQAKSTVETYTIVCPQCVAPVSLLTWITTTHCSKCHTPFKFPTRQSCEYIGLKEWSRTIFHRPPHEMFRCSNSNCITNTPDPSRSVTLQTVMGSSYLCCMHCLPKQYRVVIQYSNSHFQNVASSLVKPLGNSLEDSASHMADSTIREMMLSIVSDLASDCSDEVGDTEWKTCVSLCKTYMTRRSSHTKIGDVVERYFMRFMEEVVDLAQYFGNIGQYLR